jgi:copper(I)-binding protein
MRVLGFWFLVISTVVASALLAGAASAHEYRRGTLQIDHPWARSTPPLAKNGAVYVEIRNTGAEPDRLIAVSTPAAEKAELHRTVNEGNILTMSEVPVLVIAPDDSALLHPGGLHIMLTGLKAPLQADTEFPLILRFEKTGPIEVAVRVERRAPAHGPAATPSAHGH